MSPRQHAEYRAHLLPLFVGGMMAGVTFVGWYPITPSSSLCESLIDYLKKYRRDPESGKTTYAVIQAEDELAALGMRGLGADPSGFPRARE